MIDNNQTNLMIKCIFLGNLSVGKTSIILRYTKNEFAGGYIPTIGADFTTCSLKIDEEDENIDIKNDYSETLKDFGLNYTDYQQLNSKFSDECKVYIWDLAGQPLFKKIRTYYISHAFVAVIVIDLSKESTYDIESWIGDVKQYSQNADFLIVGNKLDLVNLEDEEIQKRIKTLEDKYKKKMLIVSAKSGENIKDLFLRLKLNIIKRLSSEEIIKKNE